MRVEEINELCKILYEGVFPKTLAINPYFLHE